MSPPGTCGSSLQMRERNSVTETDLYCEGCGALISCDDPLLPSDGLALNIGGHHGGFNDDTTGGTFNNLLVLCHDCVLRLVGLFPILHLKFGVGCHPSHDTPCCPYGWRWGENDELLVPNESLNGWVPMPEVGE